MSRQGTIRRYTLILEKVSKGHLPSFSELQKYLSAHGFEVSQRTVQRDLEQMRTEFGMQIDYDRFRNGYFINKEVSRTDIDQFLRFLEIVNTAELLTESLQDSKEALSYISFESQGVLKGIEHLKAILFAIRNHRQADISYQKFMTADQVTYRIHPYLLKEYQNRWYVFGYVPAFEDMRTYGVDRIGAFDVLDVQFAPPDLAEIRDRFDRVVGLNYSGGKMERVLLSLTPQQANYLKTLPLHFSQKIISETPTEVQVELFLIPNFELSQKLLSLADQVRVLKPQWLADEIKETAQRMVNKYGK